MLRIRAEGVCESPLYCVLQCCSRNVLALSTLDCGTRKCKLTHSPAADSSSLDAFKTICADKAAQCCSIPRVSSLLHQVCGAGLFC